MKRSILILSLCAVAFAFTSEQKPDPKKSLNIAREHLENRLKSYFDTLRFPRTMNADTMVAVDSRDWTSGFYSGVLWQMYDYTKDKKWEQAARKWTSGLEKEKYNTNTHDLGFMLYCSFGNGLHLTNDPAYKDILIQGAKSLCTRFNAKAGVIKSWDHGKGQYLVIIDNMMNLEFLFWATKVTGDSSFYKIAVTHANTTMKNHFRADNSSYHVLNYDTETGKVISKKTAQGYADESAWARGQAWGLYGYTMTYRETKDKKYLDQAVKIADFFLNHRNLPKDKVPYWDFNAPDIPNTQRDASAAAIAASGLLELGGYVKDGKKYIQAAEEMLTSLSSPAYLAKLNTNQNFILMHSVGHKPAKSEIDVPINYADYYYVEALMRYDRWILAKK
ncbi:MAG TPA: glycoside hydrolase family 88 protein [Chryseolinea sp.]|nr:glycoside hydrolase family 88 protein [Chryseolinea sp.]HPH46659.1 glycoside hydrolase family 88 protein [Chryseolinea sp.]